jgi:hypothetical protein
MGSERGQGTIEYLAVVLLVAVVLGGAGTAVASAAGVDIAGAVTHQIHRALCIVTGGDCDRELAPCETGSSTEQDGWKATVAVIRIGRDRFVIRRRLSDGSELVTLLKDTSGGVELIRGAKAKIPRYGISVGGTVTESLIATYGGGKTWAAPNRAEADRLVAAFKHGDEMRRPDQNLNEGSLVASVGVSRSADRSGISGVVGGKVSVGIKAGRKKDNRTCGSTFFLEEGADVVVGASAGMSKLRASLQGDASVTTRIAVTVDRDGRWTDLALVAAGELGGGVTLPTEIGPLVDALNVPTTGARRLVSEAHLDLSDGASLEAAKALVSTLGAVPPRPGAVADAARVLAQRIDERAVIDVRAYELDRTSDGFDIALGNRVGFGYADTDETERTRLIAATTRGLDGTWHRRTDCLKEGTT